MEFLLRIWNVSHNKRNEFIALGLLRESKGNFVLTRKGKELADSVAEAFL